MRLSFTTWRLCFKSSLPDAAFLDKIRALLQPIAQVRTSPEHGLVFREIGLCEYDFIEPPQELNAGDIALQCLTKAHLLGTGWSIMWPAAPAPCSTTPEGIPGWRTEDLRRAAAPEFLSGLNGGFNEDEPGARSNIPELYCAGFMVTVLQ